MTPDPAAWLSRPHSGHHPAARHGFGSPATALARTLEVLGAAGPGAATADTDRAVAIAETIRGTTAPNLPVRKGSRAVDLIQAAK
jgi:hypothetical protein